MAKKMHKSGSISQTAVDKNPDSVQKYNQLAIAALIVSIVGFYFGFGIIGVILGVVAYNQIRTSKERQKGRVLAEAGIALGILGVCTLMLGFTGFKIHKPRWQARNACCISNLKMLSLGITLYAEDYDGQMPPGDKWSDAIKPRTHNDNQWYICAEARSLSCGYSFYYKLDKAHISTMAKPTATPLLFDSTGGWNSTLPLEQAEPRHNGGYNCSFVDGHAKWFGPKENAPWLHK